MAEKQKLKPCPFCGGPANTVRYNGTMQATCAGEHIDCAGTDVMAPIAMWEKRAELTLVASRLGWVSIGSVTFASTPFGSYEVRPNTIAFSTDMTHELAIPGEKVAKLSFQSEDEGRDAAQADYDRRVSAAVTLANPTPAPRLGDD